MKYIINYNEQGKILGFAQGKTNLNIEVDNITYVEAMKYNKIIVDGDNITFDKVDWRTAEEIAEQAKAEAKAKQLATIETLTVTTSQGNTFDANNQARLDMSNAIQTSEFLGITETTWRMADDSEVYITLDELNEALALAIQEYARVKSIGV